MQDFTFLFGKSKFLKNHSKTIILRVVIVKRRPKKRLKLQKWPNHEVKKFKFGPKCTFFSKRLLLWEKAGFLSHFLSHLFLKVPFYKLKIYCTTVV